MSLIKNYLSSSQSRSINFVSGKHGFHVHTGNDISTCESLGDIFRSSPAQIHGYQSNDLPERYELFRII